ncbi:hypothetical protein SDC9_182220 [bioreactor metagenome]|uniref:Uncharacterized protein n=1 Tax=bioreactor metagenome TaxID=1076179 RepID=A0A645H896_9ZZZZ
MAGTVMNITANPFIPMGPSLTMRFKKEYLYSLSPEQKTKINAIADGAAPANAYAILVTIFLKSRPSIIGTANTPQVHAIVTIMYSTPCLSFFIVCRKITPNYLLALYSSKFLFIPLPT